MTRRLLQAMAGAPHGGAETFFVRLAGALQRAGEAQRVVIRHCPDRSGALREAGVAVTELRFGGPFDVASRIAFRREIAEWRPEIVLTWMNRATAMCPTGRREMVAAPPRRAPPWSDAKRTSMADGRARVPRAHGPSRWIKSRPAYEGPRPAKAR